MNQPPKRRRCVPGLGSYAGKCGGAAAAVSSIVDTRCVIGVESDDDNDGAGAGASTGASAGLEQKAVVDHGELLSFAVGKSRKRKLKNRGNHGSGAASGNGDHPLQLPLEIVAVLLGPPVAAAAAAAGWRARRCYD